MKTLLSNKFEKVAMLMIMLFSSIAAFAQDATKTVGVNTSTTTTTTTEEWYTNPLYWIIGAVLLIILVAVVARGNGNKS